MKKPFDAEGYRQILGNIAANPPLTLFNLEAFFEPPAGGHAQSDGSIKNAPWRARE